MTKEKKRGGEGEGETTSPTIYTAVHQPSVRVYLVVLVICDLVESKLRLAINDVRMDVCSAYLVIIFAF